MANAFGKIIANVERLHRLMDVGPWWRQQEPYMGPSSARVLEEGMVVALEPHIGYWRLQDMALVTADSPRLLSSLFGTGEMLVAG